MNTTYTKTGKTHRKSAALLDFEINLSPEQKLKLLEALKNKQLQNYKQQKIVVGSNGTT